MNGAPQQQGIVRSEWLGKLLKDIRDIRGQRASGFQGQADRHTGGRKLAGMWEVRLQEWKVQEEARSGANTDNRQGV